MVMQKQTYRSLAIQVAERIATEIRQQTWVDQLPGERMLAETLNVSRKTIRKAVSILQHEGMIQTEPGCGHQIVKDKGPRTSKTRELSIGLLVPESVEYMRPFSSMWIYELRALLNEQGLRLTTFPSHRFFTGQPEKALTQLITQNPQNCWILAYSNERIQQWFHDQGLDCVVAGSGHPGLELPNVDLDYFALCRHASGAMLRNGHRRLAFLTKQSERPGDLESEAGFDSGASQSSYAGVSSNIFRHDGTVEGVNRMLNRMFKIDCSPTAILVANPSYYLTTTTFLAQKGLRVPNDVSLISRDDDVFLSYLNPSPARYSCNPKTFARRLLQPVLAKARGEPLTSTKLRIDVKYLPGGSLGHSPEHS